MHHFTRMLIVVLALSASIAAQPAAQADRDVANRIAALARQLDQNFERNLPEREWRANEDRDSNAIRAEVTSFVERRVQTTEAAGAVEARLKAILSGQELVSEDSDVATARIGQLRYGRTLMVGYTVAVPPHNDTAHLLAFLDDGGRYRLAATAPQDFTGYSMFTREVASPAPGVMYVLAGGRAFTFNGSKWRFRLYAFDGGTFATLWAPDDVFQAQLKLTPKGFAITAADRAYGDETTTEYETTLNGVVKVR